MKKITAFLWFDSQAEEAANFYTGVFKNSKVERVTRYPKGGPMPQGSVMTVEFKLDGVDFVALNAGPAFKFTEAISFTVNCESQEEIDYFWKALTAGGGSPGRCGWLKDKFGLSWQINPCVLHDLLADREPDKAQCVMEAMLKMDKIDIATLHRAYHGS